MDPTPFIDTIMVETDSDLDNLLLAHRSAFTLEGRSLDGLQANLTRHRQQRHQEPHLRCRLFTLTEGLESPRSPFVVMAEPCLRDIRLMNGKGWDETAMGATMEEVLARKRQGSVKSGSTSSSRTAQSTQERPRKSGFIFPDFALLMDCPCGDPTCPFTDCLASAEVKALQHIEDHRRICERVKLAVSLWNARQTLDGDVLLRRSVDIPPFKGTYETTVNGAIKGIHEINKLADPRLLSAIDGYEVPLATGLHVTPNPVASPAGRPLQWSTYYPPHILNLDNIVRQAAADRQARVALAQELGYALSLVEVSNGRRHAVIVGTGFTRILVRSPDEVFIELRDWHPEAGLSPHPVLIRELLATVGQTHLGHFLLDRYDRIDHVPLQLYLDLYARSVHDRLSHATVPHLSALHSDSDAELDFDGSTAFSVDRAHRLRVVATARQSKLAGTAKQREKEDTGAQSGACGIGSGGGWPDSGRLIFTFEHVLHKPSSYSALSHGEYRWLAGRYSGEPRRSSLTICHLVTGSPVASMVIVSMSEVDCSRQMLSMLMITRPGTGSSRQPTSCHPSCACRLPAAPRGYADAWLPPSAFSIFDNGLQVFFSTFLRLSRLYTGLKTVNAIRIAERIVITPSSVLRQRPGSHDEVLKLGFNEHHLEYRPQKTGNGGGSGGESGGSGGFPPVAGEGGREGGGRGAGGQGGPSARSGSAASAQSGGTSHSMSDLIFDLDLGGLDIAAELTPADIAAVNPTNASLPLGADAQTYAAARSKQEEQTDDDEEETRFQLPEPTPAAWASFVSKLDHAESSLEAKQVLEDRAHLDCTLALFAEVLDERERAGCRFVVVSPAQMEELLDRGSAAAEQRFAERFAERHGSQAPVGFPADVSARSPPDLTQSDSTDSPSPVLSALMPTVPSPPSTDADAVAPETDKGAAPSEHFRVWDAEHA
ncbi:hypothetical protein A1Q1_00094 [Trichosporon asahii var. asahii CBS 2479]|uniref:Uncharacterized protein n=1 Tax=Trichosporon asahii var. asahii (strain ATCC 90039 / CBS 2479 / JCM 2466 / KCTC 7840 / NBRC 103889/ NCYC 2677 / UAMH 7654) TaxID=1186058 RepID=J8TYC9_TRIAS|nr:hypothetical protein A1Q1_00094 [Trichosporon asahii var. asahii CBS 2479]EJT53087.1 hypothetical protein A1Q1_00094 [Trichosporon asahii var. asahii CBS 2479]